MRDIVYLQAAPNDYYYSWQTHLWLESLREIGKSDKAISAIFVPQGREFNNKHWENIQKLYPEATFKFYEQTHNLNPLLQLYVPIIRPYVLIKLFQEHPELEKKAILYTDCDILFNEKFNIDKYLDDDICYLSDTNSYINASYFDSKVKDVLPSKLEEYKQIDVLHGATKIVGISREVAEKNNLHSGGAQYLLKNIDWTFWDKMMSDTLNIKKYLSGVNRVYFEDENKGFQSFCSDMWGVLWNLWNRGQKTQIVPEMEFVWSSDPITKLDKPNIGIFHNAGIVSEFQGDIPVFFKGKYHNGLNPFKDPHLDEVHNNERSKTLANWYYVKKLIELREKYSL